MPVVAFSRSLNSHTAHVIRIPYHIPALARLIRKHRARVVLSFLEQANIINILASNIAGHRAVISQRINPRQQYESKGLLGKVISQTSGQLYPKAARIIAVSNGIVEAMACCGCPVIATDCPTGPREILGDNEYGLLVPVDDPEALARSVEELLTDKSRRAYFQEQARKRAQDFDLEQIGLKYVRLLQSIAETRA